MPEIGEKLAGHAPASNSLQLNFYNLKKIKFINNFKEIIGGMRVGGIVTQPKSNSDKELSPIDKEVELNEEKKYNSILLCYKKNKQLNNS
jgi:hypothetical protein